MVGGLVEEQEVGRLQGQLPHQQPGLLPAREVAHPPVDLVAGEEQGAQGVAGALGADRVVGEQVLQHRAALVAGEALGVGHLAAAEVLAIEAEDGPGAQLDPALQRGQLAGEGVEER